MVGMKVAGNCLQWQQSPAFRHIPKSLPLKNNSPKFLQNRSLSKSNLRRASFVINSSFTNDNESDEEFVKRIQQLVVNVNNQSESLLSIDPPWKAAAAAAAATPPQWPEKEQQEHDPVPAMVEMNANSVDLPLSLRIIKKKKKWEETFRGAGEQARCSVKKAFSSMVFIVRELQSYTIQMREVLFLENLEGVLARVQEDMNASFVWLFQQIFSCTPTLMVYVMLLLANFTVHSIGSNYAVAAVAPVQEIVQMESTDTMSERFVKTFSVGKTASVNGNGGGGGTAKPVAGGTDDGSYYGNGISGSVVIPEEEAAVWNKMVEEATKMQASTRDEALMDPKTLQMFVSPVKVEAEPEDTEVHTKMEMMYHQALSLDPENSLLLSNFAQFLYLVLHDHDRAEYYFKRAIGIKPADAESFSRYATFLWLVRKDITAAEDTYLEAISAEPSNTYYAANYAHFLWNTGGEDTCYPLDDQAC